jgi:hypothetical protein
MTARTITALRPNVSRNEALDILQPSGAIAMARRCFGSPLQKMADVYIPFRIYRVSISSDRGWPNPAGFVSAGQQRPASDRFWQTSAKKTVLKAEHREQVRYLAADTAFGVLDPYEFTAIPGDSETVNVYTRNAAPSTLDDAAAAQVLTDRVRRLVFTQGFFRLRRLQIQALPCGPTLHIPYWVGFYGSGDRATLRVIDAVRRRPEGAKIRDALTRWLAA